MLSRKRFIKFMLIAGMMLPGVAFSGGPGGHSDGVGGKGTFVQLQGKENLVFWDLWQDNQNFEDKIAGEKIMLSPSGLIAHGEWIDSRKLKAHAFIKQAFGRIDKNFYSEGLPQMLDEIGADEIPLIFTDLPVAGVAELAIPHFFGPEVTANAKSIAGAYFDGRNNRIFVNIDVWNRAGLKSQAALLLHERLRALQPFFALSNDELQDSVAEVIDTERAKHHWRMDTVGWFSAENLLSPIRRLPLSPASGSRRPIPATKEILEGRQNGILGGAGTPSTITSEGEKNALGTDIWAIFDPMRCMQSLHYVGQREGSTLRCLRDGSLGGKGTLWKNWIFKPGEVNQKAVVDVEVLATNVQSKFAFEVGYRHYFDDSKKDYDNSIRIDFETEGEIIRMTMNGKEAVEISKKDLLSLGDSRKIRIQVDPWENRIEVSSIYSGSVVTVAKWSINLGEINYIPMGFGFSMEEGTILRAFYVE